MCEREITRPFPPRQQQQTLSSSLSLFPSSWYDKRDRKRGVIQRVIVLVPRPLVLMHSRICSKDTSFLASPSSSPRLPGLKSRGQVVENEGTGRTINLPCITELTKSCQISSSHECKLRIWAASSSIFRLCGRGCEPYRRGKSWTCKIRPPL